MSKTSVTTPEGLLGRDLPPAPRVRAHLLDFLRWRFSKLPEGSYRWDPSTAARDDQSGSEIFISAAWPLNPAQVGQRPAITATSVSLPFSGLGINDLAYVDLATGAQVRMDLIPTTTRIHVLSRVALEAERLAFYALEQIWAMRESIVKAEPCLLQIGQRPILSEVTPPGALIQSAANEPEWRVVTIMIPTFIQHSVSTEPMNKHIVRDVRATMNLPQDPGAEAQSRGTSSD